MIEVKKDSVVLSLDEYFRLHQEIESLKQQELKAYAKGHNDGYDKAIQLLINNIEEDDDFDFSFLIPDDEVIEVFKKIVNRKGELKNVIL